MCPWMDCCPRITQQRERGWSSPTGPGRRCRSTGTHGNTPTESLRGLPVARLRRLGTETASLRATPPNLAVIDNTGNIVCATPSGGAYWRSVFFPDLGCTLSTRSEIFSLEPGHPNVLEPG